MKVILTETVDKLGELGETVKVSDGYARNYLFPRKMAVAAESGSAKQLEHEMRRIRRKEEQWRAERQTEAKKLEGLTVEIQMRSGEGEKLFGSVTTAMIAEKLRELGHEVDRKAITLEEPIKALGIYTVPVKLAREITASVKVWVTSVTEETEEAAT